jgi:hypothetical protein
MPINRLDFRDLVRLPQIEGREPSQSMWHPWIAHWATGKTVLDVGSGVSTLKRDLLALGAASVTTQDPCAWCQCDLAGDVESLAAMPRHWDLVTCIDVIEHVVDYGRFAWHLAWLAVERVIITTPGVLVTQNANPHHYHEFRCDELVQLIEATSLRLEVLRVYDGPRLVECEGQAARELAASDPAVSPMGFVFRR